MPIYAYKCTDCGHQQEVLQKISDAPLTDCSECGRPSMAKQVTAAGFQLKGTGWYVTDFRDKSSTKKPAERDAKVDSAKPDDVKSDSAKTDTAKTDAAKTDTAKNGSAGETKSDTPAADKKPAASANACGGGCACH